MEPFEIPLRPFLVFLVVLARVGGLVSFAPFWSHKAANAKIRIILAFVLALALAPAVADKITTPPSDVYSLALVLIGELLIGALLGFAGRIIFTAFELAAHFAAAQMGFSLAGTIDPSTQAQTTAFGTIAQMLGLMVLLGADGHHWFLTATVRSFALTPVGDASVSAGVIEILIRLSANAIAVGVSIAAPSIIVLLSVEFALEFFGRTAPQFQVFILGFPIKIAVGLWLIGASVYFLPNAFRSSLAGVFESLGQILTTLS